MRKQILRKRARRSTFLTQQKIPIQYLQQNSRGRFGWQFLGHVCQASVLRRSSIAPEYRYAAPIARACMRKDRQTRPRGTANPPAPERACPAPEALRPPRLSENFPTPTRGKSQNSAPFDFLKHRQCISNCTICPYISNSFMNSLHFIG